MCVVTANAVAAPRLSVTTDGGCPDRDALVRAVTTKGLLVPPSAETANYSMRVHALRGGASLRLSDASGTSVIERQFTSVDCRALADAMAVVVEAYFVDLGTAFDRPGAVAPSAIDVPPTTTAPAAATKTAASVAQIPPTTTAPAAATKTAPPPSAAHEPHLAATPSPPPSAAHEPHLAATPSPSTATPPTKSNNRSDSSILYPRGLLGIGAYLALPPTTGTTLTFDMGVGVDWARFALATEFVFATTTPVTTGDAPDRVRRWASHGLLRVSTPFAGSVRVRPWAALGMTVVQLQELDLPAPQPTKTTQSLVVGAGVELGLPIIGAWSARFDLGCLVLVERDEYFVQAERIGAGPWATCGATVGAALGGRPSLR